MEWVPYPLQRCTTIIHYLERPLWGLSMEGTHPLDSIGSKAMLVSMGTRGGGGVGRAHGVGVKPPPTWWDDRKLLEHPLWGLSMEGTHLLDYIGDIPHALRWHQGKWGGG